MCSQVFEKRRLCAVPLEASEESRQGRLRNYSLYGVEVVPLPWVQQMVRPYLDTLDRQFGKLPLA